MFVNGGYQVFNGGGGYIPSRAFGWANDLWSGTAHESTRDYFLMGGSDFTNKYGAHQSQTDFVNGELYVVETTTRWREYGGVADETSYSYETTFTKARGMDLDCPKCGLFERLWNEFMSGTGLKENREENAYGRFLNNLKSLPGANIVIVGPGGQEYEIDFSSGNWGKGPTGVLDLGNANNVFNVLNLRVNSSELDATNNYFSVHFENPLNQKNEYGYSLFMASKNHPGLYYYRQADQSNLTYYRILHSEGKYLVVPVSLYNKTR
ncbi:hypothetical protein C900_00218 [Fulvivirga imtechensis AK7]|uniref:Uncharacterized protein n=1 Tax=Fulvivirga imtechensis AK7 TaxID=1237149 RepID=L8JK04_9BACT|nr:hypothetical protein C900_00218 [Fulvivirga imtechensis AK7]